MKKRHKSHQKMIAMDPKYKFRGNLFQCYPREIKGKHLTLFYCFLNMFGDVSWQFT